MALSRRRIDRALISALEPLEKRIQMDATYKLLTAGALTQDWSNTGLISANDNWSGVPSIQGYRGDNLTGGSGAAMQGLDPETIVAGDDPGVIDVNANQLDPNGFTTGGVAEFDALPNPVVAFQGSATAQAPYLKFYVNTTGASQVEVKYNLRDVDGSTDNAIQPVALQYRVGESGTFTNIPAAFVSDASNGPSDATKVTPIDVFLPADALNQPKVQLRVITTNAVGSDEWIGVDDINVSTGGTVAPTVQFQLANFNVLENVSGGQATITVTRSGDLTASSMVDYATVAGGTATDGQDYTSTSGVLNFDPMQASTTFNVAINNDSDVEPNETIDVQLTMPTGATLGTPSNSTITIIDDDTPPPTGVLLNEIDVNPVGTDDGFEYIEITGGANQNLSNVYALSVEGDSGAGIGSVDVAFNLSADALGSNGLLLIKSPNNTSYVADSGTTVVNDSVLSGPVLENGTNSFLLVYSLTPITTGTDLDPGDEGTLTLPAGATLLDGVGWMDGDNANDHVLGNATLTQSSGSPDAASRLFGNTSANDASAWYNGDLLSTGNDQNQRKYDTAKASSNIPRDAIITPGAPNFAGDGSTQGEIGFAVDNYNVSEEAGPAMITLVRAAGSSGAVSVDYSMTAGTATAGSDFTITSGTVSFADGQTTATFPVQIIDDAQPEDAETINLSLSNATNGATIGVRTAATVTIVKNDAPLVLNEVEWDTPGTDAPQEFIEVKGTPGAVLSGVYFASVEGDSGANIGQATTVVDLSGVTVGSDGLIWIRSSTADTSQMAPDPGTTLVTSTTLDAGKSNLQNGTNSFLIITSPTTPITTGMDLDTNNDGTLDLPSGATMVDGIGETDGGSGDVMYGAVLTMTNASGTNIQPGAATRFSYSTDPLFAGAWYFGQITTGSNLNLTYNATFSSANLPSGGKLTPGAVNFPNVDITPPTVMGLFNVDGQPQSITLSFSENVDPTFTLDDVTLSETNAPASDVPPGNMILTSNGGNNYTITFQNYPNNALPDGRYHFVIHAGGVTDTSSNALANDFTLDFAVLSADATGDGKVNALDFNALATHFGSSGTFSQGDFNYDGSVGTADFMILVGQFGKVLPASAPAPGVGRESVRDGTDRRWKLPG